MKLYLAGPIRGLPLNNYPAFDSAAAALRAAGHVVANPVEHARAHGFGELNEAYEPEDFHALFRWDLESVMESEGVAFLPGWRKSRGSCAERTVAHYLGIPCFDVNAAGELSPQARHHEPAIEWTARP